MEKNEEERIRDANQGHLILPTPKRGFTGYWIPAEIVNDPDLRPVEKLLIAEIYALQKGDPRGCRASNQHLASHVGMTAGSVVNALTKLRRMGYIKDIEFDGRNRWIKAILLKSEFEMQTPSGDGGRLHQGMERNITGNKSKKENATKEKAKCDQAEQIWEAYPRKVRKPNGLRAIRRALREVEFEVLLERTQAFAQVWSTRPTERWRFIPHPATWFNAQGYNDGEQEWSRVATGHSEKKMSAFEIEKRVTAITDEIDRLFRPYKWGDKKMPQEVREEIDKLKKRRTDYKRQLAT